MSNRFELDPEQRALIPTAAHAAARRFGDAPVVVDSDGLSLSFSELDRLSDEVAAGLSANGVGQGSVCALTLDSGSAYLIAYVGATKAGSTVAGINPRLPRAQQDELLALVEPAVVLEDSAAVERLRRSGGAPVVEANPDRPVAIVFSSGTSGRPKGAWFTDRQLAAICLVDTGGSWANKPQPMIAATQFAHVGFSTKLLWYLRMGMSMYVLDRWQPDDVAELIERHRIPLVAAVAPQLAILLDADLRSYDLSSLRSVVAGGAASGPHLIRQAVEQLGVTYSVRYSSTESGGVGTAHDIDRRLHRMTSAGRPRPGVKVRIVDPEGDEVVPGETGTIEIGSPTLMSGYWGASDLTNEVLRDGWLATSDLGFLDRDGFLTVLGRSDDGYVRGGYNVAPGRVEAALATHPKVAAVAVVPKAHALLGQIGVAAVVPADNPPGLEELRAAASSVLAHHELPEGLILLHELPLTPLNKVDRRGLEGMVERAT